MLAPPGLCSLSWFCPVSGLWCRSWEDRVFEDLSLELIPSLQHQHISLLALTPLVWSFVILFLLAGGQSVWSGKWLTNICEKPPVLSGSSMMEHSQIPRRFLVGEVYGIFWAMESTGFGLWFFRGVGKERLVSRRSFRCVNKTNSTREWTQWRQWLYILTELLTSMLGIFFQVPW